MTKWHIWSINMHKCSYQNLIDTIDVAESYLAALCEVDRQEEVSMLLDTIDIKKVTSKESRERIFKSLGSLTLESHAKKFILELKTIGDLFFQIEFCTEIYRSRHLSFS